MTTISLNHVCRYFGSTTAVDDVSLTIPSGSLFFLLGPSGCGKTTLLRLISGLDSPTSGEIWFDSREVSQIPVEDRNVGIVFQQYALWPHMSVLENIRFGLTQRRMDRGEIASRIDHALTLTHLVPLAHRMPSELSGGQQQRVALARALALKPAVLLFDEPLSNLDPHLRHDIREQLLTLHHTLPTTMIYVTHDIEEALSMADEIALLNQGRVEQSGVPRALFHRPRNEFVARFMGEASIIEGTVIRHEQKWAVLLEDTQNGAPLIILPDETGSTHRLSAKAPGRFVLRPHYFSFPSASEYRISGCIEAITFTGPVTHIVIRCTPSQTITVAIPSCRTTLLQPGMTIEVSYQPADIAEIIENSGRLGG